MSQPVRVMKSPLTRRVYAITDYKGGGDFVMITAKTKHDVTDDVLVLFAELREQIAQEIENDAVGVVKPSHYESALRRAAKIARGELS